MTHGSKSHREHGSTGAGTTPARTFPGLKQAGHMGHVRITVKNLQVRQRKPGTSHRACTGREHEDAWVWAVAAEVGKTVAVSWYC